MNNFCDMKPFCASENTVLSHKIIKCLDFFPFCDTFSTFSLPTEAAPVGLGGTDWK